MANFAFQTIRQHTGSQFVLSILVDDLSKTQILISFGFRNLSMYIYESIFFFIFCVSAAYTKYIRVSSGASLNMQKCKWI